MTKHYIIFYLIVPWFFILSHYLAAWNLSPVKQTLYQHWTSQIIKSKFSLHNKVHTQSSFYLNNNTCLQQSAFIWSLLHLPKSELQIPITLPAHFCQILNHTVLRPKGHAYKLIVNYTRNNKKDGYRQLNVRQLGSLRHWDHRSKCYMDRKRIQCLSNASQQHVPIYLQPFLKYSIADPGGGVGGPHWPGQFLHKRKKSS